MIKIPKKKKGVDWDNIYMNISPHNRALCVELQRQNRHIASMDFLTGFLEDDEVMLIDGKEYKAGSK